MEIVNSEVVAVAIYRAQCIRGSVEKTRSGQPVETYFDLRRLPSRPHLKRIVMEEMLLLTHALRFDNIVGVPEAGNVYATTLADRLNKPQLFARFELKPHGIPEKLSGIYQPEQTSLVIEDTATSGSGILETVSLLKEHGLKVSDAVVILDRQEGARENIEAAGIRFHALTTASEVLKWSNRKIARTIDETIDSTYLSE